MDRRTVLVALGTTITAGCGSSSPPHDTGPGNETENESSEPTAEGAPEQDRHWYLLARWVDESPPEVTPYPSDEPPVNDFDIVLGVFERAAEQSEADPPIDSQSHVSYGGGVSEQIPDEKKEAIQREFSDIEEYKSSSNELYYPTGRYFDHDGTIIALQLSRPD